MANFVSACKNVIASNNRRGWAQPLPSIRVSNSPSGAVTARTHTLAIKDSAGNSVARIVSTVDGNPVIKYGAKVAIITKYETEVLDE